MKSIMKIMPARALCAFCLVVPFGALAQTAPVVQQSSVTAAQAYPSKDVNISYTISDAVSTSDNVWIIVSSDGGTTWTVPASSFSGAQGLGVPVTSAPTVQNGTWHAGNDWNGNYTTTCRVRVIACNNNMVLIPAGSYLRGNPPALGDSDITDAPQYSVNVNAFLMDNNYVSGYLWTNVLGYASSHGYTFDNAGSFNGQSYPVTSVNWYDAVKWCNARSQYEGVPPVYYTDAGFTTLYTSGGDVDAIYVKPGVNGYRLPTEAEWEKAARGGLSGFRFPWGNTISESQANYYGCISVCGFTYDLGRTVTARPASAARGRVQSAPSLPTDIASTIWPATYMRGAGTGMVLRITRLARPTLKAQVIIRSVACCAAVRGTAAPTTRGVPIAPTTHLFTPSTAMGFVV